MKPIRPRRLDPAVLLVTLLVAANVLAVLGMVAARRDARGAVHEGAALETRADARAFEARLASEHAQLEFLATSPPLASSPGPDNPGTVADPVASRWARIDLEATLLLYLQSSPAVVRLRVSEGGEARAVARRTSGVPTLASPEEQLPLDTELLRASWPLDGGRGVLEAWLDPRPLVADLGPHLRLHRARPADVAGPLEKISSPPWTPPLEGWLERVEGDTRVLGAVERLADLYRLTLLANVALLPLTLLLGALTVRRIRRLARLESERRQQEQLRALELQVQHSERLASLGRFAAGMAHEINNPLEGIANYLQLLREDLDAGDNAQAAKWLPRLDEGVERVAGTVRQVLRFAEPGAALLDPAAGGGDGPGTEVEIGRVLERTVDFLRRHPDCRDAELRVECPPGLSVRGDAVSLDQLVLNLVLNACQAQEGGGEVTAAARADGDHVEMRILDRGPGLAPEIRDHLFEPFQSTRGSSGLGLAVCHGIVTRHRGQIEARARRPGPGTEIRVRLPRRGQETRTGEDTRR